MLIFRAKVVVYFQEFSLIESLVVNINELIKLYILESRNPHTKHKWRKHSLGPMIPYHIVIRGKYGRLYV